MMNAARVLRLQPFRVAALQQGKPIMRNSPLLRQVKPIQARNFHNSRAMFRAKEEDHSAHTITQRLRSLKKIPPELLPLGVVIFFALFAACFAMGRKLFTDRTLRLRPQREKH